MNELVSVIIPCYNPGNYLYETIESVEKQTYENYEIIIVDDESTDLDTIEALKVLADRPKISIFYQNNSGPGIARNLGVKKSKGDFIVFLDSDDLIRENTIKRALMIFENKPDVGVVYGDIQLFQNKTELRVQAPFSIRRMFVANQVTVLTALRKQTFIDAGGYDFFTSKTGFTEDYDLWLSIAETKWKFFYVNETFFDYRILTVSRTSRGQHEKDKALSHIYKKHSDLLYEEYVKLYHDHKNLVNTLDYKLGHIILSPLRKIKRMIKSFRKKMH